MFAMPHVIGWRPLCPSRPERFQVVSPRCQRTMLLHEVSQRVLQTDPPVIVKTKQLMAGATDVKSLAQGIVYWAPPESSLELAADLLRKPAVSAYGPCDGSPELIDALEQKLRIENGLHDYRVMVTAGANQAFVNVVLTLLDAGDSIVLFVPYYFNHLMAIQMTGGAAHVIYGQCDPTTLHPDLDWLEKHLQGPGAAKMVVIVNPCNPTGVLLDEGELRRAAELCERAGAWLVMDNTYEHFVYEGRQHICIPGPHIIHLFSFSKAFGMMGWRVGYIAYPGFAQRDLGPQLLKVQDTIPICPPQLSQVVALGAVQEGRPWVLQRLQTILPNRELLLDALSPLGSLGNGIAGGEGAIYLWAKLPPAAKMMRQW
eukprot:jgi/Botrbrau1/4048/Bobra.152_3s0007.2